jgi:hypothetical protein
LGPIPNPQSPIPNPQINIKILYLFLIDFLFRIILTLNYILFF